MDWQDLKAFVGSGVSDDSFVEDCWNTASELVDNFIGVAVVPVTIRDTAVLRCGSELFHAKNAPNGLAQFGGMEGAAPARIARDPMVAAYPLLSPYMVVGF